MVQRKAAKLEAGGLTEKVSIANISVCMYHLPNVHATKSKRRDKYVRHSKNIKSTNIN